ncbi:unnamed protein product [Polarella glacialis]|uniref:Transmembrane protein n=1 Tax=Polarella glacialis TaxID=89957 RepID=A0A813JH60_POLGL|nr:unnamed protein product [Polarella glacialis]
MACVIASVSHQREPCSTSNIGSHGECRQPFLVKKKRINVVGRGSETDAMLHLPSENRVPKQSIGAFGTITPSSGDQLLHVNQAAARSTGAQNAEESRRESDMPRQVMSRALDVSRVLSRRESVRSVLISQRSKMPGELLRVCSRDRLGVGNGSMMDLSFPDLGEDAALPVLPGSVQARLDYAEHTARRRATSMLILSAVFGLLGFLVAAGLGMWRTYAGFDHEMNLEGLPFPSGQSYWPGSVSEMVNDPRTPSGKCWKCFQLIAAISLWLSWYPWELRNVYVGGGVKLCSSCHLRHAMPFLHARTFIPPIGMLMVVLIPIASPAYEDFEDTFASYIHLSGAVLMLGGHGVFEFYTLAYAEFVHIEHKERMIRWIFCLLCLFNGICFFTTGNVGSHAGLCCADVRRIPTEMDIASARAHGHAGIAIRNELARESGTTMLYDTASGRYLALKYVSYWCEVFAGFSMIAGLATIWFYAPERKIQLSDELPGVYSEDEESSEEE